MKEVNLKEVAASGFMWNAFQKYSILGVTFFSSIILARLLTPYDYGCIGLLQIFIAIATIMIDSGFGAALLQKKRPTQEDYSTIFYWNIFISLILYFVLFFAAPYISRFYKIDLLTSVLRIQGLVLFINAFKMIQSNILRKRFQFKSMAITVVISSIISVFTTIVMAYYGYGVWALVVQQILISLLPMMAFWFITKWIPLLNFSYKSFKELFGFGSFMFLTGIINTLADNVQGLLIGRFYNPTTMGYYTKAKTTEGLASTGISQIIDSMALQLYSEVQDDIVTLGNILKRLTSTLAYITCPVIISLVLIAEPLFIIMYSDRWAPCVPYFQVLAVSGLAICLQAVNLQAIAAIGKSKIMFTWTLIKRVINIILIIIGLLIGGIYGLLLGMVIGSWLSYFINAWLVSQNIGYKMKAQILDLLPIVLIAACAIFPVLILKHIIYHSMVGPFVLMIIFIVSYFLFSMLFKIEAYKYCKELIPFFINKIIKRRKQ